MNVSGISKVKIQNITHLNYDTAYNEKLRFHTNFERKGATYEYKNTNTATFYWQ